MEKEIYTVPFYPTPMMWCGFSRTLVKYMQAHSRYCPKTMYKFLKRTVHGVPSWLTVEVERSHGGWENDHAFTTATLGVFIYQAMLLDYEEIQYEHNDDT